MSERNHSPAAAVAQSFAPEAAAPFNPSPAVDRKRKLRLIAGGALASVLIAAILFQFFRSKEGGAGPDGNGSDSNGRAARRGTSTVLATVDGYGITWKDVADECVDRYGREVLDNLINRTIIQQACAKRRVVVTKAEVANEVRRIARKFKMPVESWYQMLQAERGISPLQYHRDIIWPMLALKKIAGAKVDVGDDEMRKAFIREYGQRVKARLIMMDNQRRIFKVHDELVANPESFERLAQQYSIEPNSRAMGGEIPPIRRHGGNEKLETAAFKLRTGEISPVIQIARSRFVVLKCEGRTKQVVTDVATVREELYAQIKEEKTQAAVARTFEKLKRETTVDNFLTNQKTGIQQASGTKDAGTARIRSPFPSPGAAPRQTPTFR
jgi:foldase protein PrsA